MYIEQSKLTDNVVKNIPNENSGMGIEDFLIKNEEQSGFFANKKAWNDLDIIKPKDSRYWFECMWRNYKNTKIIGIIKDKIDPYSLGSIVNKY